MNRILVAISLMLILCSVALSGLASGQERSGQVEGPRFKTACPPVSANDQARIERQISNILGDELREVFGEGALPLNASVVPLTDSKHRDVCEYLTRVHKSLVNGTTRLSEKAENPVYKYSVAYFEAGSFYLVRIGINPERLVSKDPTMDRVVLDRVAGTRVHLKENLDIVRDHGVFVFGPEHQEIVNDRIRKRLEDQ